MNNQIYERRLIKFAKGGKMKYIGHLDLLRVFQSAIRRAKLPVAYSMGFNPHQRLSFAMPLPVGMDSVCEYMEILFNKKDKEDSPVEIAALDGQLPDGLRILSTYEIPEKSPSSAGLVTAADYRLTFPGVTKKHIQPLKNAPEIIVMKKTKRGEKETDIRPDILALEFDPVGAVMMCLSAGSARNLSPVLVAKKIYPDINEVLITRQEMYGNAGGRLVPLHEAIIN